MMLEERKCFAETGCGRRAPLREAATAIAAAEAAGIYAVEMKQPLCMPTPPHANAMLCASHT